MSQPLNKAKTGANAILFVVLVLVGVVFVNIVAARYFKRVDCTHDKIFTLSPASKELVNKLPDRLTVKAFISKDLQPPFSQVGQYVRDLLDEYATASNGKLHWEVIDPAEDTKLEEEATKMKVPKMRRGRISSNKVEIGASYLGVAFQYQGNIESIPEINSPEGLEYQMSSIIKMLTQHKKKIALANGEGELSTTGDPRQGSGMHILQMFPGWKNYDFVPVKLGEGQKPIPDDADALVVAGPKQPLSERAKWEIDQFIMKGKSVAFFVDGMVVEAPRGMMMPGQSQPQIGRKNDAGLDDLLEHYGFKIKDDIVLEPQQTAPGPVPVQGQLIPANYYTFAVSTDIAQKNLITDGVQGLVFPLASSVELVAGKQQGASYTALAKSSREAWRQSGFFLFDPENNKLKIGDERGPFTFGYEATGKFTSFFAGKPHPDEKGNKVEAPPPNASLPPGEEKPLDASTGNPHIIVFGSSNMLSDMYLQMARMVPLYQSNGLLFFNVLDDMAQDAALSAVRAKGVSGRPLTIASDSTPTLVTYGNVLGVPLLFILFGVVRWRVRSARRKNARIS